MVWPIIGNTRLLERFILRARHPLVNEERLRRRAYFSNRAGHVGHNSSEPEFRRLGVSQGQTSRSLRFDPEGVQSPRNWCGRVLPRTPRLSTHSIFLVLVFACFAASASYSHPQQSSQPPSENAQAVPTLHVTTRLVEVNVIVNDKHGNPISGLTQRDFSILDKGKPQEIRAFSAATNLPSALASQDSL